MKKTLTITERTSERFELFVDLDGVLADFSRGMTKILRVVHGGDETHIEGEYEKNHEYRRRMWRTVEIYQRQGGELWYGLELMEDAMVLWEYIRRYEPQILSATGGAQFNAAPQKHRWVAEKLGEHVVVNLTEKAALKSRHAAPHRILIDDKTKALNPWEEQGGIGILHTSAERTIQALKDLGL